MRKLVLGLLAVAVVVVAVPRLARLYDRSQSIRSARGRVEQLLAAVRDAGGSPESPALRTAACLWFKGTVVINERDELIAAERGFAAWRASRRLGGPVRAWRIESAALPDPTDPLTVLVVVSVDGQPYQFTVQPGQPIL